MDWEVLGFIALFGVLVTCIELLICFPLLKYMKKVRSKNYDKIDTKVIANKISEKGVSSSDDSTFESATVIATYEWFYKGKKRRLYVTDRGTSFANHITMNYSGSFPDTLEITINKKNGKYKRPESERISGKLTWITILISFAIGYYLTVLILGPR